MIVRESNAAWNPALFQGKTWKHKAFNKMLLLLYEYRKFRTLILTVECRNLIITVLQLLELYSCAVEYDLDL